ncbi:hypothetical protein Ga0609869_000671 [Rhodovulum iodosum]|uniref:5-bromo-4-chloroindolyl phosphate hydrolysis protein n=1 Tax=Rhodovulum iodosum TaxID=68291 RepID=A0ABV3XSF6_9RHOB|nr:5-bromo-4-chloroindolyl phosphate hydrolysis family protein [Rhodovulum robiginosum]RSK31398.1 hypothetical protein EJA01_14735 [Rhodovulum robiginosum]
MARRFGGEFSPKSAPKDAVPPRHPFHGKRATQMGGRVNALFLAPLPLAVRAFFAEPVRLAAFLAAFGLLILAAWLTREGLKAQMAYEARKVARRPALPRKIIGSVLTGAGLGLAGMTAHGPAEAVVFAILGAGLHFLAFGPDPLSDKGMDGIDTFQQDRVARVIDEAEKHLAAMTDAIRRAGDRGLEARVEQFQTTAREMFRTVEEDPRDLTAARRYLVVYLLGARDATIKFSDLYSRTRDSGARTDYEAFLNDLEQNFAARTAKLLLDDRADLDIEIEVLRERLQREGVRPEEAMPHNGE